MRIVGGEFRGRRLVQPKKQTIRPTSDRNREMLFNIISHKWPQNLEGARVLDVFAGTGALGLEAISRGAESCLFVESNAQGAAIIQQNIEALNVRENAQILQKDATKSGNLTRFSDFLLVFADPPYGKGLGEQAIATILEQNCLADDALVILEERRDCLPDSLSGFRKCDERNAGETVFGFFKLLTD